MELSKETLIAALDKDYNKRKDEALRGLFENISPAEYSIAEKWWKIVNHEDSVVSYGLFKHLHCHELTIESVGNFLSVLGNLFDDATFGFNYDVDRSIYQMNKTFNENYKRYVEKNPLARKRSEIKPVIHTHSFSICWVRDDHHSIIDEKEMADVLDWFISFADGLVSYERIRHPLASVDESKWENYPKQFKTAYEEYVKEISKIKE